MSTRWSPKDPEDIADYWFDWTDFLPEDEAITASTVTVPAGLTSVGNDFTDKKARVRLSGGAIGKYEIDNHITTDAGQQFDITKTLEVKERTS